MSVFNRELYSCQMMADARGDTGSRAIGTRWCKDDIKSAALRVAAVF